MAKRNVTEAMKKLVAAKQKYKCANKPGSNLFRLEDYKCPLWSRKEDCGLFDESGYEIDHIIEHSKSHDDSESNLQALCVSCHRVKTKKFNMSKKGSIPVIKKMVFYSLNKKRVVNICTAAKSNSKIIGQINYGNQIDIYETRESGWNKIKCNNMIGYVKIEYCYEPLEPDDTTVYVFEKKPVGFFSKLASLVSFQPTNQRIN